jgi:hypothetical protein
MIVWYRNYSDDRDEFEALQRSSCPYTERLVRIPPNSLVVGRYSVLPYYQDLELELAIDNSRFINSWTQHRYVADIRNWYQDLIGFTPQTWTTWHDLPEASFVLKGLTNSRKHSWDTMMFAATRADVTRVAGELLKDQMIGDQGLVVRRYIPLRRFDTAINGLPITNEWRCFYSGTQLLSCGYYWSNFEECKPYDTLPDEAVALLNKVAPIVAKHINFWVVDIAETDNGDWIVIELNDGQMSGLSMIDPLSFYETMRDAIR